ncbi:unnamed protein product [Cyclocybe aegerita]|uniref:Uncharacterized protein n=1 Tax=Cyclocybe aegerita TaxID=1973307 RepID=A0A8S0VUF3_CYCAE|nr:unnamed protein product [Cyclocybe aegerita]
MVLALPAQIQQQRQMNGAVTPLTPPPPPTQREAQQQPPAIQPSAQLQPNPNGNPELKPPAWLATSPQMIDQPQQQHGSGWRGRYRPRGQPTDQELEDTESDERRAGGLRVSESVVAEKLKTLTEKRGTVHTEPLRGKGRGDDDEVLQWARVELPCSSNSMRGHSHRARHNYKPILIPWKRFRGQRTNTQQTVVQR